MDSSQPMDLKISVSLPSFLQPHYIWNYYICNHINSLNTIFIFLYYLLILEYIIVSLLHNWCGSNGSVPEPLAQQNGGSAAHNTVCSYFIHGLEHAYIISC
ncbi:hypothetical protein DVH24_018351 [Malus domestica]|uniref:Uncharacterized protein n=1 Tax=Malus domestica TaxID=3750 RepID=A0A498KDQ6_MALDO|nr:hypothetical protein DVH24_018351 [Malus domestica]